MNPIERFFNQLKHYMKKDEPMSFVEAKKSVRGAIMKINKDNLKKYFESSLTKTKKEIDKIKSKYHKKPKIYKD